jgi:hypothetical protein
MRHSTVARALKLRMLSVGFFKSINSRMLILLFSCLLPPMGLNAANLDLIHVRLIDQLDWPNDGYCLDILGANATLRVDLPLFIHN